MGSAGIRQGDGAGLTRLQSASSPPGRCSCFAELVGVSRDHKGKQTPLGQALASWAGPVPVAAQGSKKNKTARIISSCLQ